MDRFPFLFDDLIHALEIARVTHRPTQSIRMADEELQHLRRALGPDGRPRVEPSEWADAGWMFMGIPVVEDEDLMPGQWKLESS